MTRFAIWLATILLVLVVRPALGAPGGSGGEPPHPISAAGLTLEEGSTPTLVTSPERLERVYWTVVSGEQASFVVQLVRLDDSRDDPIWEGSVESQDPWFDIASEGPEWLFAELTAGPGCFGIELTLCDRSGEAGAPSSERFAVIPSGGGAEGEEPCGLDHSGQPPHEADHGMGAWGDTETVDVEWEPFTDTNPPSHEVDHGVAAWGEIDVVDVDWDDYD